MTFQSAPAWLAELGGESSVNEIGSKAHNLSKLHNLGFAVPPCGFVSTLNSAFAEFESAADYLAAIRDFSEQLPNLIPAANGWAVRSSATVEDMPGESHAGRFDTVFIADASELAAAVEKVWDSGQSAAIGPESMGVVIQELVDAEFAGVAFSHDPTNNAQSTVIEGVPGNAARFVDGEVTPWRVRPGVPCLTLPDGIDASVIAELDNGVQRLASMLDMPVDTEWALSGGKLFWLQVRPLTGSSARDFVISDEQKPELKGLWVRINHSFAPQATLVATMNPGGYFNGPGWKSRLVNNFHYIQEQRRPNESVPLSEFDAVLDTWDHWEREFEKLYRQRIAIDLATLNEAELWSETCKRIDLSQQYFTQYSDRRFLEIRDRTELRVREFIDAATGGNSSSGSITGQLLAQLGSLTEEKQRQLKQLAKLHAADSSTKLQDRVEWKKFIEMFGSESPTTHLFYLPTMKETQALIMEMVEQMTRVNDSATKSVNWHEVADSLADKLPDSENAEFKSQLTRWRRCMLRTEDDDYALSKCTMLVRDVYLEAGQRLLTAGLITVRDDVFHLSGSELEQFLSGRSDDALPALVEKRKAGFLQSRMLSPPPMILNGRAMSPKSGKAETRLVGTPASPGVASGIVLVLKDPFSCVGKKLPENSVVVAPIVTPALAYSLIGCAAIVTEIGGLASHGAIVAREMAIPAVVGVPNVRSILQTGMSVTVDGSQGEINIVGMNQ